MFNEKFLEVITHEGVVSIVTSGEEGAHVSNTWNSYLVLDGDIILIPAAGMRKTQANIEHHNQVKLTLGTKEVMGYRHMGTGFLIEGTARFLTDGPSYLLMKDKFPFLSRVLVVEPASIKQTL
jgi:hypothetical protein